MPLALVIQYDLAKDADSNKGLVMRLVKYAQTKTADAVPGVAALAKQVLRSPESYAQMMAFAISSKVGDANTGINQVNQITGAMIDTAIAAVFADFA